MRKLTFDTIEEYEFIDCVQKCQETSMESQIFIKTNRELRKFGLSTHYFDTFFYQIKWGLK